MVLYWLSWHGYECARIDHVGIDLIARNTSGERMGISVKCRSRYEGTESVSINLPTDGFEKAQDACDNFGLSPYYAIVVHGGGCIRCFVVSLPHLLELVGGKVGGMRYWQMTDKSLEQYRQDQDIEEFQFDAVFDSWREAARD
ncbi:MAG: hypothetical protein IT462_02980 [Planctomycetes bacterium]|nr:hypothetical protein [Planctomycetota bacterium]